MGVPIWLLVLTLTAQGHTITMKMPTFSPAHCTQMVKLAEETGMKTHVAVVAKCPDKPIMSKPRKNPIPEQGA